MSPAAPVLLCAVAAAALAQPQGPPIRRVVLYKHGVGYFERRGTVEGDADVKLRFKAADMSDVLKSLTVLDLGGGAVQTITYDSTKTVDQQLGEYTFDLRKAQGLPAILEQMKGGAVTVTVAGRPLRGRIMAVEKRLEATGDGAQTERYRLSLLTEGAMVKSYDLSDVSDLRFDDPALQKDLEKYLAILFSRHRRDEKELVIRCAGRGKRELFVSYVQAQPVWKVSYRIVASKEKKPLLQAWAIVDNVSAEDWENVELSLVSGLPVSFVQNLYDPFYVKRRRIALQRETAVGPVLHAAGMAERKAGEADALARRRMKVTRGAGAPAAALALAEAAAPPRADLYANLGRQAAEAVAQEAGALFVYNIKDRVTIRRDRSALLRIASEPVEGERVSLYNESTRRQNPMDAMRIRNTTGLTLEGGPITVIEDDTYVGEALVDTMKPGEQRYISFAVDLGTRVEPKHGGSKQDVYMVRIVHGTMTTYHKQQEKKVYNLENVEDKPKTVIVEHPRRRGWKLVSPAKPLETTDNHYRFEVKLPPNGRTAFEVVEERPGQTTYALSNLTPDRIQFFLRQRYIDQKTRAFLEEIASLQAEINVLQKRVAQLKKERDELFRDQERLRNTLKSLGQTEAERSYRADLIRKLRTGDGRVEEIDRSAKTLQGQIEKKQKELNDKLRGFTFQTKV